MTGSPKIKSGSRDPDHTHVGVVCHAKANTWHGLPVHKIWRP